jgi:hypothetical protein
MCFSPIATRFPQKGVWGERVVFRRLIWRNLVKMRPESQASAVGLKACSTNHTSEQAPGDRSSETLQAPVQRGLFENTRYEL